MKPYKKYATPALLTLTSLMLLSFLFSSMLGAAPAPGGRSPLSGHLIPALKGHTPTGATDGKQMLHLTISLNLPDPAGLKALITAQNDHGSPLYHQYLTPQQFTARFAPSQASVDAVVAFLRSQGLTVGAVAANRLSIKADGTVATVEQAFHVQISNYTLDGRTVYAPGNEPSVPSPLAGLILGIGGLDDVSTPHRLSALAPKQAQAPATGPGGGYTPGELRTAYDMNSLISSDNGSGQTVALLELDGYTPSDVNTYLSYYRLGAPNYSNVLVDGASGSPDTSGAEIEVELDMEVVSAIAPGAAQKVYIAPNQTFQNFYDDFNQIVMDDTARVTSNSWGLCENLTGTVDMQALDTVFSEGAAQGQAFFSASGDTGSADCQGAIPIDLSLSVDFPASDPFVVGVGGTTLTTGSGGSYSGETVWNNTYGSDGGGLSLFFAQPGYQSGPGVMNSFSNGMREVPDVSADADPTTGYSEYCTTGPICAGAGWFEVGGTSAAAPLWAGAATDINEYLANQNKPTLGSASAQLYQVFNTPQALTAYHDITSGNNAYDPGDAGYYPATSGYDLASGIGTPDVWNLARDIAGDVPVVTPNPLELTTAPGVNPAPETITIQNNSGRSYNWSLSPLPSWLSATATSGTIAAHSSGQFTLSFALGNTTQTYTTDLQVQDTSSVFNPLPVPITVVAANVSTTWYFAEGYTGGSFSEFLTLANPNSMPANVQVQYFLGTGTVITRNYVVPMTSRFTVNVNHEIGPNQSVSMVVNSDQPIIAERPMYFTFTGLSGYTIPGGSDVLGATSLATNFDFGYLDTTPGHATFLTILNQNNVTMNVTIDYFPAAGGAPVVIPHTVNANSRGTVNVNQEPGLPAGLYSALVTLDQPGLVERPLYLKDTTTHFTGSADVVGVATPQQNWYFAEGFTASTFDERYILSNPSTTATAHATITFLESNGTTKQANVTLAPGAQQTVDANGILGLNINNSAVVQADAPILAERFISFKYTGQVGSGGSGNIPGASDVLGAGAPSDLFYFAEGYTGATFAEYLTIENPDPASTATVQVTFLPANGSAPVVKVYRIAPQSRFTLFTNSVLNNQSFSLAVESNVAIVAERPMYFTFTGGQTGGSDVIGYQPPGATPPPPPPPPTPTPTPSPTPSPYPPATVYVGSGDDAMYAVNSPNGTLGWRYQTGGYDSTASYANGILYFGSTDGYFYALNASTGTLSWRVKIGAMSLPASAVVNGAVYLLSTNKMVYALNAANGSVIWSYSTGGQGIYFAPPTAANGIVYASVAGQGLIALNASDGSLLWSYAASMTATTPAIDNGIVYFIVGGNGSTLHALNASTGAVVWASNDLGCSGCSESPTAANGVVYAVDQSGGTYAFNDTTGALLWHAPVPTIYYIQALAPAVANGIVYVGVSDGSLYAYNASDGSLLWHYQTGGAVSSIPASVNGVVYFGSYDGYIYALNTSTGVLIWRYLTGGSVGDTPVIGP